MARIARFVRSDSPTVYHIISRTALQGLPIKDRDNDYLLNLINKLSKLYFVDVLGFALMGNHFHLVVRMYPGEHYAFVKDHNFGCVQGRIQVNSSSKKGGWTNGSAIGYSQTKDWRCRA